MESMNILRCNCWWICHAFIVTIFRNINSVHLWSSWGKVNLDTLNIYMLILILLGYSIHWHFSNELIKFRLLLILLLLDCLIWKVNRLWMFSNFNAWLINYCLISRVSFDETHSVDCLIIFILVNFIREVFSV